MAALVRHMDELKLNDQQKQAFQAKLNAQAPATQQKKVSVRDFDQVAIIGRGAFGEVRLVRKKDTREIFAMKVMRKSEMIKKNQAVHIRAERDLLSLAQNPFVVALLYSFQDEHFLYLVMEYLSGICSPFCLPSFSFSFFPPWASQELLFFCYVSLSFFALFLSIYFVLFFLRCPFFCFTFLDHCFSVFVIRR